MATSYPTSLDTFTNPTSSDSLSSPSHSGLHADTADAIEALQVKVGINSSADTSSLEYRIAQLEAAGSPMKKVAAFTSSGTWTVPTGVTYAIAHIRGAGGGAGISKTTPGGTGGSSSVAFSGGTVTATGGIGIYLHQGGGNDYTGAQAGQANSGDGANLVGSGTVAGAANKAHDGTYIVAGDDVTPGASITVTIGAGGTAGVSGAAGGSGYVWIEYQES